MIGPKPWTKLLNSMRITSQSDREDIISEHDSKKTHFKNDRLVRGLNGNKESQRFTSSRSKEQGIIDPPQTISNKAPQYSLAFTWVIFSQT
jgi:hypothetical protein